MLGLHLVLSDKLLEEARATIEAWRQDYNWERLHSALGNLAPAVFASQLGTAGRAPVVTLRVEAGLVRDGFRAVAD